MTSESFLITIKTLLFDMVAKTHTKRRENDGAIQTRHNECVVEGEEEKLKLLSQFPLKVSPQNAISMDMAKYIKIYVSSCMCSCAKPK